MLRSLLGAKEESPRSHFRKNDEPGQAEFQLDTLANAGERVLTQMRSGVSSSLKAAKET